MEEILSPNRTDLLLGVIEETPPDELTYSYLINTMKKHEAFAELTKRAIIESLAHLETNKRIAYDPELRITDIGTERLQQLRSGGLL